MREKGVISEQFIHPIPGFGRDGIVGNQSCLFLFETARCRDSRAMQSAAIAGGRPRLPTN